MPSQCAVYDFRIGCSKYDFTPKDIMDRLHKLAKKFVFQLEKGDSGTEYLHWQGRFSLWKRTTPNKALTYFLEAFSLPHGDFYCRVTSNDTAKKGNFDYVMKLQSHVQGPWTDKDIPQYIPRQYRRTPYPWQQAIIDTGPVFNERGINVIIDEGGNIGKSVITGILKCAHKWHTLNCFDDGKRLVETVCDMLISKEDRKPNFVIDIPRALDNKGRSGVFAALETVKSGIVSDSRNHYKEWTFDSPQIWVFTNNDRS